MDYSKFLIDDKYLIDYVIYKFKNKINGKVYIGQTTKSLRKRVIQHLTTSRPNTKCKKTYFHNALNKYGIENFDLTIIERCSTKEELDNREIYWIAYYNSTNKLYGYNTDSGGTKGKKTKPLTEYHKLKLIESNLGKHRSDITKLLLSRIHKQKWLDPQFRNKNIGNIMKVAGINKIPIYLYDTNEKFIKKWESTAEVCSFLYGNKRKGNLKRNITLNNKNNKLGFTKNGFIWSYYSPNERRAY